MAMQEYDLIVIGGGTGNHITCEGQKAGLAVALIEPGPLGGTCLNRGCVPSKMLIYPSDVIMEAERAKSIDTNLTYKGTDFRSLMERVVERAERASRKKAEYVNAADNYHWFQKECEFIDEYVLDVSGQEITAPQIVIASGTRPVVPPIDGLKSVDYLDNRSVLNLREQPKSIAMIGGGYIAVEYGHFFSAIGTDVTIIGRSSHLVENEDEEASEILEKNLSRRMRVLTSHEAVKVSQSGSMKHVTAVNVDSGEELEVEVQEVMLAAGRRPNSDRVKPENSGVKIDDHGFVETDEYLRTNKKGIWSVGDANGRYPLKHVGDREAEIVWENIHRTRAGRTDLVAMDYSAIPRAVFSDPPIARVGLTLNEARKSKTKIMVGVSNYTDVAKGDALGGPPGFCRIIVDSQSDRILGATIVGPDAPHLIQCIVNVMHIGDRSYKPLADAIYIHPALPEVVRDAARSIQ